MPNNKVAPEPPATGEAEEPDEKKEYNDAEELEPLHAHEDPFGGKASEEGLAQVIQDYALDLDNHGPYEYQYDAPEKEGKKWRLSLRAGYYSMQGLRPSNEDGYCVCVEPALKTAAHIENGPDMSLFAIFDGHAGGSCSKWLSKVLCEELGKVCKAKPEATPKDKLYEAVKATTAQWEEYAVKNKDDTGSTLVAAYLEGNKLAVANVGDSRCVLARGEWPFIKTECVTRDHKPELERARVEKKGGAVRKQEKDEQIKGDAYEKRSFKKRFKRFWSKGFSYDSVIDFLMPWKNVYDPLRCWPTGLSMARSVGDSLAKAKKPGCVIDEPDMFETVLTPEVSCMGVCCDGVWDTLSAKRVGNFAMDKLKADESAVNISQQAFICGSSDNISSCVIFFVWEFDDEELEKSWKTHPDFDTSAYPPFSEQQDAQAARPIITGDD